MNLPLPRKTFAISVLTGTLLLSIALGAVAQTSVVNHLSHFDGSLRESSGLAIHGGFLWTINDSGAEPLIHKLDTDGNQISSIRIDKAINTDWESLASDDQHLYIADTGNNFNRRDFLVIYRVSWASLETENQDVDRLEIRYGDYRAGNTLSHNFDSEALAVRGDELWLFTKNRGDLRSNLYRFPKVPGNYSPMPSQSLEVNSPITAADINPRTGELALIGNRRGEEDYLWRMPTSEDGVVWEERSLTPFAPIDQWEAVLWDVSAGRILLSHEQNATRFAGIAEIQP